MSAAICGIEEGLPDVALMSSVKVGGTGFLPAAVLCGGSWIAMIVQRWGRGLETSVIKL
jgi:hypothetical protein